MDPGSSRIGWSITSNGDTIIEYGFLSPIADVPKSLQFNQKMNILIKRLIPEFTLLLDRVDVVAWEIVPSFGTMAQRDLVQATATTLKVLTFMADKPYQQFSPQNWHKIFVGKGKCTKAEVKSLVLENNPLLLSGEEISSDLPFDVFDAMAIGLVAGRKDEWITSEL